MIVTTSPVSCWLGWQRTAIPNATKKSGLGGAGQAALDRSISDMGNEAVQTVLAEDAEDLASFTERKAEKSVSFDAFVQGMKRRGRL